jgi:hypothetical protein
MIIKPEVSPALKIKLLSLRVLGLAFINDKFETSRYE